MWLITLNTRNTVILINEKIVKLKTFYKAPAKLAMLQKQFLASEFCKTGTVYLVNEYPKSGGTWLKFMLSDALKLPTWTRGNMQWKSCVMQAHWLKVGGNCKTVALFRDGRDVMVSFYYHSFFINEFQNGAHVKLMRDHFSFSDYEDIKSNLLPFMRTVIENPLSPNFSWIDFVRFWAGNEKAVNCHYEDLRNNTAKELLRIKNELHDGEFTLREAEIIAERYSMENMRQKKAELNPGMTGKQIAEKSFIRKGSVGGWSEHFTDEALDWFEDKAGEELKILGYSLGR